jgi:tetratricopeptide (TPR) repeat protein
MVPPAQTLAKEYYNLGNSWFDMKKYDQAARAYQNALTWDPALKIATLNLARTKAEMGDPAAAMDLVAPLAKSEPDNMAVAQYRAWLTARWKGPAAAADLYADLARRLPGDAVTQYNAGLSLAAADRTDEALETLRKWKALDGKTPAGLTALAGLLDKTGSPEAAEAWYDVVHSLPDNDPRRFQPLASRARDLEKAELYGDAVAAWDLALALPAAPDQTRPEAQFRRAQILLLRIDDYDLGSAGLIAAWKAGYHDPAAWKALLESPLLTMPTRLQADLKLAGVTP